jgi:outer membrane lipoprotein carrier protein
MIQHKHAAAGEATKRPALILVQCFCALALTGIVSLVSAQTAALQGLESLESFVKNTKTGSASFTQTVTSPSRDGQTPRTKSSSGSFEFSRPNRFRFIYKKPFEQSIVSDGQTLWLHDVGLNQVTTSNLAKALNGTPAALIASATDIKGMQAEFVLKAMPDKDGFQWVQATPKTKDGQLQSFSMGFKATGKGQALASLEILDGLGQRSVMTFNQFEVNPTLPDSVFKFTPPVGADVVKQ